MNLLKQFFLKFIMPAFKPVESYQAQQFKPEPINQNIKQRKAVYVISWGSVDVRLRKPYR
ncbi:hypothetical protein CWC25_12210 [Pseudoalteromonas sp. S4389]|nr:hypothetical protein CWC25_12210 [Pseudoalteromonas sp. S4389]